MYDNSAPFSDHKAILLKFKTAGGKHRKGLWKMNASVIITPPIQEAFKHIWKEWKDKKQEFGDIRIWWDLGKKRIKDVAIWCANQLANERKFERTVLENRVKYLRQMGIRSNEINQCEQKLKDIYIQQSEGGKIRSRVSWWEEGKNHSTTMEPCVVWELPSPSIGDPDYRPWRHHWKALRCRSTTRG